MGVQNQRLLPLGIIVAAILISGALLFTIGHGHTGNGEANVAGANGIRENVADNIRPVGPDDYVRGSTNPKVVIVEYSDLECPFCKAFHATLQEVVQNYGDKVAWVYRQFPIQQLHSQAPEEAVASECVGKLGGNDAFWKFIDTVYATTPSNNGLNLSLLPTYAGEAGVPAGDFNACMGNPDMEARVNRDLADVEKLVQWEAQYGRGSVGTPFSVVVAGNKSTVIAGAESYAEVRVLIDALLNS